MLRSYLGAQTLWCAFLRVLKPTQAMDPVERFEAPRGEPPRMDWMDWMD
jgi:hypothetical protein